MAHHLKYFCRILLFFHAIILFCGVGELQATTGSFTLFNSYRVDSLDWTIASDFSGTTPNILSELQWTDLQIFQMGADAEIIRPMRDRIDIVLLGKAGYGWILAGDNQDSDYAGDNRTLEWSRSNNDAGDGHVLDLSGGVGLRFKQLQDKWTLTPQLGYAYSEQDLVIQQGFQTLSVTIAPFSPPPAVGPIAGLNSSYYAWWFGPWLGLQAEYQQSHHLLWDLTLRWHSLEYQAEADWNLRTDLKHPVSFEHAADGDGISINIGLDYLIHKKWDIGLGFEYRDMQADNGIAIIYLDSGGIGGTRFNEVNWASWVFSCSLQYTF